MSNVENDPNYLMVDTRTRSELCAGLMSDDSRLLGVLVLESNLINAFNEEDVRRVLQTIQVIVWPQQVSDILVKLIAHYMQKALAALVGWIEISLADEPIINRRLQLEAIRNNALGLPGIVNLSASGSPIALRNFSSELGHIRHQIFLLRQDHPGGDQENIRQLEEIASRIAVNILYNLVGESKRIVVHEWLRDTVQRIMEQLQPGYVFRPTMGARPRVAWIIEHNGAYCEVDVTPMQLELVLQLLIENALDAIQGPGLVRITTSADKDTVEVHVTDDGPGIPKEIQAQLFSRLATTKGTDHGQGLLLARSLIESMSGTLRLEASSSKGTTFVFTLPTIESAALHAYSSIRILVVENDLKWRDSTVRLLRMWNYVPIVAEGFGDQLLDDAAKKAHQFRCQIALIDVRLRDGRDLKDLSGLELAPRLRPTNAIIFSATGDREIAAAALTRYGALNFVAKEDNPEELRHAIERGAHQLGIGDLGPQIIWPFDLSSDAVRNRLLGSESEGLADESDELIKRMFPHAKVVRLTSAREQSTSQEDDLKDYSYQVLELRAVVDDDTDPLLIKIGRVQTVENERNNYERYVKGQSSGTFQQKCMPQQCFGIWERSPIAMLECPETCRHCLISTTKL